MPDDTHHPGARGASEVLSLIDHLIGSASVEIPFLGCSA